MELIAANIENEHLKIHPFTENDIEGLAIAAADASIWTHYVDALDGTIASGRRYLEYVLKMHNKGEWIAHTIKTPDGEYVGQSCYLAIRSGHNGVEIGGTWYNPKFHGTKINPAAKLALLENAFGCGAMRVEFKTDENNLRSRAALLKLGCQFEGIFRKHMMRGNGTIRNSAYFSIIDDEWSKIREKLLLRLID